MMLTMLPFSSLRIRISKFLGVPKESKISRGISTQTRLPLYLISFRRFLYLADSGITLTFLTSTWLLMSIYGLSRSLVAAELLSMSRTRFESRNRANLLSLGIVFLPSATTRSSSDLVVMSINSVLSPSNRGIVSSVQKTRSSSGV